jgi:hypothetical protein
MLTDAARYSVTILAAAAGSGKSVAIAQTLAREKGRYAVFAACRAHRPLIRFARGVVDVVAPIAPAVASGFGSAVESASRSADPSTALATWFAEHLIGDTTIALDDLHHVADVPEITTFIAHAIDRGPESVRWILGLRSAVSLPVTAWLAGCRAGLPIEDDSLALAVAEARAVARALLPAAPSDTGVEEARRRARGHVGRFTIELLRSGIPSAKLEDLDTYARREAQSFVRSLSPSERRRLFALAASPSLDDPLTASIPKVEGLLARFVSAVPGCSITHPAVQRFSEPVLQTLDSLRDNDAQTAEREMIQAMAAAGRSAEALRLAVDRTESYKVVQFLDAFGLALLDAGYGDLIREAAGSLLLERQRMSPAALTLEAIAESDAGRYDLAESRFRQALDLAGQTETGTRITYYFGGDLMRRGRMDCIALLESLGDAPASPGLRGQIAARLGCAYALAGQRLRARSRIAAALSLVAEYGDPVARAAVYQNAAFVSLQERDPTLAEAYADRARAIAEECGRDDLAATALSISYAVALSFRDDPDAALGSLERFETYASRTGNTFFERFALLGRIEIAAERGDRETLYRLERFVADKELENDVEHVQQALVPSSALRATWGGDFLGAYRLLVANAEADRNGPWYSLRWSEIGLYAAAAGLCEASLKALQTAQTALPPLRDPSALACRARLNLALTAALLGRQRTTAGILATLADLQHWPRLQCYREAIESILLWHRGTAGPDELLERFASLQQVGFGGIAAMLEALPYVRERGDATCM